MTDNLIELPCLVLIGPTAIGKTDLSLILARQYDCEIVSIDSMQVYRHMDIGTAKATPSERREIPHYLIDIVDPDEEYDAARFAADGLKAIRKIHSRGKIPLLTGGTGLYLRALLEGIFPGVPVDHQIRDKLRSRLQKEGCSKLHEELSKYDYVTANKIHPNDSQRLLRALEIYYISGEPWSNHIARQRSENNRLKFTNILQLGLTTERQTLYQRINKRCQLMLEAGLEREVRSLLQMGYSPQLKSFGSIGYRHMVNYIEGRWSMEEMQRLLARDTRRYAKRQYTWFSRVPELQWFDVSNKNEILSAVQDWYNRNRIN